MRKLPLPTSYYLSNGKEFIVSCYLRQGWMNLRISVILVNLSFSLFIFFPSLKTSDCHISTLVCNLFFTKSSILVSIFPNILPVFKNLSCFFSQRSRRLQRTKQQSNNENKAITTFLKIRGFFSS